MKTNINLSENARRDGELIIAARLGVEKAFEQLMKRYKNAIYFMLLKMVNNRTDAEDLTIEAFEKAFINIHQYDPQFAFSTWLFCIASNNAIDHLRKKRVNFVPYETSFIRNNFVGPECNYNVSTTDENPEEALIKKQNARLLHQVVSTLKPQYRILLEMRYFKQYSYSEICKELNLPLGTVKVQLFRSRELLCSRLRKVTLV